MTAQQHRSKKTITKRPAKHGRYQYGPFRVFVGGFCKGDAYLNLVQRKHQRFYLVANVYEWGRWPRFTRKGGHLSILVELPKAAPVRAVKRLKKTGTRTRKLSTAAWHEKYFEM
jgi:hypothetical protein